MALKAGSDSHSGITQLLCRWFTEPERYEGKHFWKTLADEALLLFHHKTAVLSKSLLLCRLNRKDSARAESFLFYLCVKGLSLGDIVKMYQK